ncbi:MAG: filamentous hemagglutinin N-terminal domain-containing protein, partial [Duganella sp.]
MTIDPTQRTPGAKAATRSRPLRRKLLAVVLAAAFETAHANPVTPTVVHGAAAFAQQGNLYTITNTPNTIIDWRSFSIAPGEITRFIQQSADSKVLNRVTGQDPSQILGALQSNGKVFLINPNGVLFGAGARVDVNGLVASSLAMSNADFLAGKNTFTGGDGAGKVANQGSIATPAGGQIFLIAPSVENSGVISAPNGDVVLAAGRSVQLFDSADPKVQVLVSAPADQALNLGSIVAQGGRVGVYGALVAQRGAINASSAVRGENGRIILKASGTTLLEAGSTTTATGNRGGRIEVLGARVGLTGNALVDASGDAGGGTVLVGGDYQGRNAAVANAQQTFVGSDAVVRADALVRGDGGQIVVWGDDATRMHGALSARGGVQGGNGGLVETSGHYLDVIGARVTTGGAGAGKNGTWLLDPYNITVGTFANSTVVLDDVANFGPPASDTTQVDASLLNSAVNNIVLQAQHDINFDTAVTNTHGVSLTALAGNDINVNAPLAIKGGVSLTANEITAGGYAGTGMVTIAGAGPQSMLTTEGDVSLSGSSVTINGRVDAGAGQVQVAATDGIVTIGANGAVNAGAVTLAGDRMALAGSVRADRVGLDAYTSNREIGIGAGAADVGR